MKNLLLAPRVQRTIDIRVDKILNALGNPQPPLRLEDVRHLLRLNLGYFQSNDDGILQKLFHKIIVAGKQVLERPAFLVDVVNNIGLKGLYLPDRKKILIDQNLPLKKHRWVESHEIIHDTLDWHNALMLGDTHETVPGCREKLENEANYGAGRLLFFGSRFIDEARSYDPGFDVIKQLEKVYGNSITTTLWRYVEMVWPNIPMVGIISGHPHPYRRSDEFDAGNPCRYFIQSPAFATQFSSLSEEAVFDDLASYCGPQRGGPLGEAEIILKDDNGDSHIFHFQTFFNRHDALTFGRWTGKLIRAIGVDPLTPTLQSPA
jgi:hypothetical protein